MTFRVVGLKELERGFTQLAGATAKAEARAVNRAGTSVLTAQTRAVTQRLNVRVSRIREATKISRRATPDAPSIVIRVEQRPIGLIEFGGRWRGMKSEGASAQVFRDKGRHTYTGTFIAIGRNGNRQIFSRKIVGGKRAGRLPIRALYGPSAFSEFKREDIQDVGRKTWETRLPIELQREIAFALKQSGIR
jgi:hypothetical protein